jgi:outer membrane protein insertion porin family
LVALFLFILAVTGLAQDQGTSNGVISRIDITGAVNTNKESILSVMRTKVGQPYIQANLDADQAAIQSLGFFSAVDVHPIPAEGNNVIVTVTVSEFPIVKEIRITGNTVISTDAIMKVVTVKIGQPFNLRSADPTSAAIAKLYDEKGYFALITDIEALPESQGTVNIAIQEMRVNSVGVEGNVRTRNSVMRRLIRTKPGTAFNRKKWDDDLKRMVATRWFEKVTPDDQQSADGTGFDLLAVVKEARTGQATVGVSLSPTSGLAGSASIGDSNLNGTGQSVGVTFMQSITGGGPSVDLNYGNPFIDNSGTGFNASIYSHLIYRFTGSGFGELATNSSQLYTERRTGGDFNFTRPLAETLSGLVGFRGENVHTSQTGSIPQAALIKQDGDIYQGSLGLNLDNRDLPTDPSRGDWANLLFEPGLADITEQAGAIQNKDLLGTHLYQKTSLEYRAYWTPQPPRGRNFDAPRRVFALRVKYGFMTGVPPFFEQFFVGGADTLRGYDDDRFWGTQELISSLEYRYPIQKSFNLIPFIDYGGAWGGYGGVSSFTQSQDFRMHFAAGLGVAFRTPLGQIRIDFGINENGGNRTTFLIGNSF